MSDDSHIDLHQDDMALVVFAKRVQGAWAWFVAIRRSPHAQLELVATEGGKADYNTALMAGVGHVMDGWVKTVEPAVMVIGASPEARVKA